jgi:hypothetical protein
MNGGGDLEYKYDEVSRKAGQHLLEKAITTGSTESTYDTPKSQYQYLWRTGNFYLQKGKGRRMLLRCKWKGW